MHCMQVWLLSVLLVLIIANAGHQFSTSRPMLSKTKSKRNNINFKYHKHEELTKLLKSIAKQQPRLAQLYSIGKSVEGRQLWVMLLSENPKKKMPFKPNVKLVANMHGNEAVGRELMLHFITHLVKNADNSTNIRNLLRDTYIHVLPSMNPDGFEKSVEGRCEGPGRRNAANVDLNRNFPDRIFNVTTPEQPETAAIRQWIRNTQFVLSANLHGGALVVNYPFDNSRNQSDHIERTPDHDVFRHLALTYARKHPKLKSALASKSQCINEKPFEEGITNGNAWYPITGSMQDYNYLFGGCMELTLELSCCKHPLSSQLPKLWNENKAALLTFLVQVHKGVKGVVLDSKHHSPIARATLTIKGREAAPFLTDPQGQFWRILLPGNYILVIKAKGYKTLQKPFTVTNMSTIVNVHMSMIN